jgi:magnesium-transporting ATPase (P-type)
MANYSPAISTIADAIQASLSPVFMLAGIGALLNVLAGRLSRVIDRARALERVHHEVDGQERQRTVKELRLLSRRMKIINLALFLVVSSAVMTCLVVAMLFVAVLLKFHIGQYVAAGFILSMALLIAGLIAFIVEVRVSMHAIRVREELLR